jgi:hypothetical protein
MTRIQIEVAIKKLEELDDGIVERMNTVKGAEHFYALASASVVLAGLHDILTEVMKVTPE